MLLLREDWSFWSIVFYLEGQVHYLSIFYLVFAVCHHLFVSLISVSEINLWVFCVKSFSEFEYYSYFIKNIWLAILDAQFSRVVSSFCIGSSVLGHCPFHPWFQMYLKIYFYNIGPTIFNMICLISMVLSSCWIHLISFCIFAFLPLDFISHKFVYFIDICFFKKHILNLLNSSTVLFYDHCVLI